MHIAKIKISNIMGVENLEFDAGKFNIITGKNGRGKTSVLEGIKSALNGKSADATLIRNGNTRGEVVLILDDNTEIKRSVGASTPLRVIEGSAKGKIAKPQAFVDGLYDLLMLNPIEFITADKKQKAQLLLESIPMEIDDKELQQITGISDASKTATEHALDTISRYHKQLFDERTIQNRFAIEKSATVEQMTKTIPHDLPEDLDIDKQLREYEERKNSLLYKKEKYYNEFNAWKVQEIEKATKDHADKVHQANNELMARKEQINAEYESKMADKLEKFESVYAPINDNIAKLREASKNIAIYNETKSIIDQMQAEVNNHTTLSEQLTAKLEALNNKRMDFLKNIPIDKLQVLDGVIVVDGVPFERLNTAKQIEIAIQIAKLRTGDLQLMCIDGLEKLDADSYNEFKKQIQDTDIQVFVTRVDDTDLKIQSIN